MKYRFFGLYLLTMIGMTSCLKDKDYENYKYGSYGAGNSKAGIGFPESENIINNIALENIDTEQEFEVALINLLSASPATTDIRITVETDLSVIEEYNDVNEGDLVPLPNGSYFFETVELTIPKGSRTVQMNLKFADAFNRLDLTKNYGLGLKISTVDPSGIVISENRRRLLIGVNIKNQYDGVYDMKGYTLREGDPGKTGNFAGVEMSLLTAGLHVLDFGALQNWADLTGVGIGEPRITVNPITNKVTITSSGRAVNLPGYDSRYDPATRTFYLGFTWGGGPSSRVAIDTLQFLRTR